MAPIHLPTITNTGATQHTTNQRDLLHDFMPLATPVQLVCANSGFIKCIRHSTLHSTTTVNGQPSSIMMRDIAYVPSASHMLISPQQLLNARCHVAFNQQHGFLFYLDEQLHLFSYHSSNLYHFPITFLPAPANPTPADSPLMALLAALPQLCLDLVHRHLGHASERHCQEFIHQSADLSEQEKHMALTSSLSPLCSICLSGKQTAHSISQQPHTNHSAWGLYPGDLLSLNLISPMQQQSVSSHIYLLTVTNSYSHIHFVWPIPNKSSTTVSTALRAITATFLPSTCIHQVWLDNAWELDALVGKWILDVGSNREPTPPYTYEYNSIDERFNQEVMTHVQCLLFDAQLPGEWWAEAACHACNIINVTPTHSNLDNTSPFSLWHGTTPLVAHLCMFGMPGMMRLHAHEQHKISMQSTPVHFMGMVNYSSSMY